jgi:lipoprotein-releasing system permease protein
VESKVSSIADKLRSGHLEDLERIQGGVIIGEELAQRLGRGMGDIVPATAANGTTRSLRIVGLIKRATASWAGQTAICCCVKRKACWGGLSSSTVSG